MSSPRGGPPPGEASSRRLRLVWVGACFGAVACGVATAIVFMSDFARHRDYAVGGALMSATYGAVAGLFAGVLLVLVHGTLAARVTSRLVHGLIVSGTGALCGAVAYLFLATMPFALIPPPTVAITLLVAGAAGSAAMVATSHRRPRNRTAVSDG